MNNKDNIPLWLAFLSLQQQAMRDWLTGLYNRHYFEESLSDQIKIARRYKRELSLVFIDIDGFKQVNDTRGHQAGDRLLQSLSKQLQTTARSADIVCRYGGDEFAVILPETSLKNAEQFVLRLKKALQDDPTESTSVTAGIAAYPCNNLVQTADQDLLEKKNAKHR